MTKAEKLTGSHKWSPTVTLAFSYSDTIYVPHCCLSIPRQKLAKLLASSEPDAAQYYKT